MMTDKNKLLNEHSIIKEEPPLIPEEPVKILAKLGLSSIKARVYLALLINQDADAKSLCRQLKKPRPNRRILTQKLTHTLIPLHKPLHIPRRNTITKPTPTQPKPPTLQNTKNSDKT
jgi:hypothetical protein